MMVTATATTMATTLVTISTAGGIASAEGCECLPAINAPLLELIILCLIRGGTLNAGGRNNTTTSGGWGFGTKNNAFSPSNDDNNYSTNNTAGSGWGATGTGASGGGGGGSFFDTGSFGFGTTAPESNMADAFGLGTKLNSSRPVTPPNDDKETKIEIKKSKGRKRYVRSHILSSTNPNT